MENRRILELAIESLENERAEIVLEIEAIRLIMKASAKPKILRPVGKGKPKPKERRKA